MRVLSMILVPLTLLAAACAPAAPAPTTPPKAAATTAPAKPAEGKPAEAKPAPSPAAKADAKPPAEWDQLLAAAKQEGAVAVMGPVGTERRDVLVQGFEQKYGIRVEYLPARGADAGPRLATERSAGQYLWDVFIGGTTTGLGLVDAGYFDPLEPALLLPEVKDPRNWRGAALEFVDEKRTHLVFTPYQRATLFVNPNLVSASEFRSYKDLLDPKWKGRMVMDDPRRAGPAQATFTLFFLHPELGPDFIRALGRQDITILTDYRQELDFVAQGRFPLLIGADEGVAQPLILQGLPINMVDPRQLREGSDVSPATGALGLFNRASHPNAAKVYVNWLLSKEAQTEHARVTGYISSRVDVPTDHTYAWRVPQPGAVKTYTREAMAAKGPLVALLREVFGQ